MFRGSIKQASFEMNFIFWRAYMCAIWLFSLVLLHSIEEVQNVHCILACPFSEKGMGGGVLILGLCAEVEE